MRSGREEVETDGTVSGFGGRRWHNATAPLPVGVQPDEAVQVRWRYSSDALYQGRGVYVDRVRVDGERIADRLFATDGWTPSPN